MDKVQKIRKEVERLKGWNNNVRNSTRHMTLQEEDFNRGKHSSYLEILDFIDSLQDESVSNVWHDMSEEAENGRNIIIIDPKDFYGAVLRKGGSQLRNHNKERYVKWAYIDDIINITKKEEPVNDELEKAAVEAFKQIVDSNKNNFLEIFKAGVKWQKEQMMEKAVDGVVTFDYYEGDKAYGCVAHDSFCLEDLGLKDMDEVKILILKK